MNAGHTPDGPFSATRGLGLTIERIDASILELPYRIPMRTASNQFVGATGLLVTVTTEAGVEGHGYSDVFARTGETAETACAMVRQVLAPLVLGRDAARLPQIRAEVDRGLLGNPRAKSALDTALMDALARALGIPLYLLLGGRGSDSVGLVRMVGLGSPEEMATAAAAAAADGAGVKLKLGGTVNEDVARVAAVRDRVGDACYLKADANEAYDARGAVRLAHRLADLDVAVLEQPVPRSDLASLADVTRRSSIAIEADQSVRTVDDARRLIEHRIVDSINTGIARLGSIGAVRLVAEMCRVGGLRCTLSNTAGSVVGDAAAVHVAVSTPGLDDRCELEFEAVLEDPFSGLRVEGGRVPLPTTVGIGVERRTP